MSRWPSTKARIVYKALLKKGWVLKNQSGSKRILSKKGFNDYRFDFHDAVEIGPIMLARIAKHTGLQPEDL